MFIKKIIKKDRKGIKTYEYYRLVHSYKVGNKNRQQTIINMGKLAEVSKKHYKLLADRIESLLLGSDLLLFNLPNELEKVAQEYANKIIAKGVFPVKKKERGVSKDVSTEFIAVDINSLESLESKSIGGEWLVRQAFNVFDVSTLLTSIGMSQNEVDIASMLLTAKLINPSSELETERWLQESSGANMLYGTKDNHAATRYRLYKAATHMYKHKHVIEEHLYVTTQNLFSQRNTIVIYDLTNMYFEGQMQSSNKANFGRSKQKRNDRRLVGLALAIDSLGFVRYNKIYKGNVSEPQTFSEMINDVFTQLPTEGQKPVVTMDAGIATEENLEILRGKNLDYVCVSRTKPKEYKLTNNATELTDNRGHKIAVTKVSIEGKNDTYLHVVSEQKRLKEQSMDDKLTGRFEESMMYLKEGLSIPRRMKKIIPVHEKVGRIKKQFSKVAHIYHILYVEDAENGVITDITWEKREQIKDHKGHYFLRYSRKNLTNNEIWDTYNMTRDVEATFRCLKTDLNMRPIHHQKDAYIEPHIWLSIMAYQFLNYIRIKLKENKIDYSWSTIVKKMESQQYSLQSIKSKENSNIYTQLITKPNSEQKAIYSALKFKDRPFVRRSKVVTQLKN